jgi:hypothetical protein
MPLPDGMTFDQVAALSSSLSNWLASVFLPIEQQRLLTKLLSGEDVTERESLHILASIVARQSDEIASLRRQLDRVQADSLPIGPGSGYVSPFIIGGGIGE